MRRALIVLLALALGACASYHHGGSGYYSRVDGHGDYYHGAGPIIGYSGPGWYGPYDTLFWSLRYSYFDPFWYPNFHYGVTFFPRYYYGWPFWSASSYWRWRGHHPYSPHYGSWWDHYYHWQRPTGPRRLHADVRGTGGGGPERYGSARNAAERMAQGRSGPDGWSTGPARGVGARQRALPYEVGALPSSRYAPRSSSDRSEGFQRGRAGDAGGRGLERRQRAPALERGSQPTGSVEAMRFRQAVPARSAVPVAPLAERWVEPSRPPTFRSPAPAPPSRAIAPPAPAVRAEAPAPSRSAMDRSPSSYDRGASRSRADER